MSRRPLDFFLDGLEPQADVVEAVRRESSRIESGWAPFWHYSSLGMYGRQVVSTRVLPARPGTCTPKRGQTVGSGVPGLAL